nr:integrase, catalytic region, zinc finger, CCHC-type, peptidase aspartic, catalytic [Tanacetum cinerariifolium]
MATEQHGSCAELHGLTSGHISSNQAVSTSAKHPTKKDWDLMFQPMFDEYFKPPSVVSTPISATTLFPSNTVRAFSSTAINQEAPSLKDAITHNTSTARTPQQNGIVERHNHMLVEVARTMLIFSKSPLLLWAEAMATEQHGSCAELHGLTSGHISSNQAVSTSAKHPTKKDWDLMFQPMFDEYFKPPSVVSTPISATTLFPSNTVRAFSSTAINQEAPSLSNLPNIEAKNSPLNSTNVKPNEKVTESDSNIFINLITPPDTSSAELSLRIVDTSNTHTF